MTTRRPLHILAFLALVSMSTTGFTCGGTEPGPDLAGNPDGGMTGGKATFTALYGGYFSNCSVCHAPNAPGRTSETEMTLNFSSKATAYSTITTGMASGLMGNVMACNGVRFVQPKAEQSLILAVLDENTRQNFDLPSAPGCDNSAITDMTLQVGQAPTADFIASLKTWLGNGAPND